jgi:hypothetical protein
MSNVDKEAINQAQAKPNGQRPIQQPSVGTKPIPTPVTVAAAKIVASQNQQQFNELVIGYLVQGFFNSALNNELGAIGQAIVDEASLGMPLTLQEFRTVESPALPPAS